MHLSQISDLLMSNSKTLMLLFSHFFFRCYRLQVCLFKYQIFENIFKLHFRLSNVISHDNTQPIISFFSSQRKNDGILQEFSRTFRTIKGPYQLFYSFFLFFFDFQSAQYFALNVDLNLLLGLHKKNSIFHVTQSLMSR